MKRIDLNVDIGEGFPFDEQLLEIATSANVCCGEHAGDWGLTVRTMNLCVARAVRLGIHPGYPDRPTMGRKGIPEDPFVSEKWAWSVQDQVMRFRSDAQAAYIKPHGGFYNDSAADADGIAGLALQSVLSITGYPLMGLPGTGHAVIAIRAGVPMIREGFADRAYETDGTLVPRDRAGAVLADPEAIQKQALKLAESVDSICLHGDNPDCVSFAQSVRTALEVAGFEVVA
jgi:UPF0271 protein